MPADRNRVAQYLKSQGGDDHNVFDVGLFVRDLTDPATPDDEVKRATDEMAASGKDPLTIGQTLVQAGLRHNATDFVARRADAMKRYTDQTERNRAIGEAESGVQKVARILGEMANAYAGGKPGEITATMRRYRDAERARGDQQAEQQLGFELQGIEGERADARAANTLEASRQDRAAGREFTAGQNELGRQNARDVASAGRDFTHSENELNRKNRLDAAAQRATTAGQNVSPSERRNAVNKASALGQDIQGAQNQIEKLKRIKELHGKIITGPIMGRLTPDWASSPEGQEFDSLRKQVLALTAPRGQGAVSNMERELFAAGVPGRENEAAGAIYDRMISQLESAIANDQGDIDVFNEISGRDLGAGAQQRVRDSGSGGATGGQSTPPAEDGGGVVTRMIGGQPVRVRQLPNGKWQEVP